jgi:hypothetical protein
MGVYDWPPINLWSYYNMHKNIALDAKANRLKLNPVRHNPSPYYKTFELSPAKTDDEICAGERMQMCIDLRNKNVRK